LIVNTLIFPLSNQAEKSMLIKKLSVASAGAALLALSVVGTAQAQVTTSVTVPGTSDPWLAGMPNGWRRYSEAVTRGKIS
jgi:ABC-type sugar transport system substrate-binding protein